jgi:23S rRNA pseudouridine2605 synthase
MKLKSLNRLLSKRGIASRKASESLIRDGRVRVNGKIICSPEAVVPLDATIDIDGAKSPIEKKFFYVAMNKRKGLVSTACDELGRATVYQDLQPFLESSQISEALFAVGRLDKDTTGLLLFTNDFAFAEWLTNPDNHVPKIYRATLSRPMTEQEFDQLRHGIHIKVRAESYFAKPLYIKQIKPTIVELTLTEGKNREVRRLFEAVNNRVQKLTRIGFAHLNLEKLNLKGGEMMHVEKTAVW